MGSGQKAMYEEMEEEAYRKTLSIFKSRTHEQILAILEPTLDNIQRLIQRDPRLTKFEHQLVEDVKNSLYKLLNVKA